MSTRSSGPTLLLGGAGAALVVLLGLAVVTGVSDPVDAGIIELLRAPSLVAPLSPLAVITDLGSTWAVAGVAILTSGVALAIGPWRHGVIAAITIVLASLGNAWVKLVIARERPDLLEPLVDERGFSFPSGHSSLGMVAYGTLAVVIGRSRLPRPVRVALIVALLVVVLLIGLSRVYLGVHYPTDVLAGWIAGAVVVLAYRWVTRTVPREASDVAIDVEPTGAEPAKPERNEDDGAATGPRGGSSDRPPV